MPNPQYVRVYLHEAFRGAVINEGAEEVFERVEVETVIEAQSG